MVVYIPEGYTFDGISDAPILRGTKYYSNRISLWQNYPPSSKITSTAWIYLTKGKTHVCFQIKYTAVASKS